MIKNKRIIDSRFNGVYTLTMEIEKLENCHDCNAKPGKVHMTGCDTEHCSVCGDQWIGCGHKNHDKLFARWTGLWPGFAEAQVLGMDLNEFYSSGNYKYFLIKPKKNEK